MEILRNTTSDLHLESSITVSALSFTTFAILCILLLLSTRGEDGHHFLSNNAGNLIVLFLGVLINILTTLSVPKEDKHIYASYICSIEIMVGVILTIFGCQVFFKAPQNHERGIGYHHSNMSLLIWVITIPLVLMGLMQAIGAIAVVPDKYKAWTFMTGVVQKLVQANVYHFNLRHKTACPRRKMGASFYLKILSLFNFVMWLDSIMTSEEGNRFIAQMLSGRNKTSDASKSRVTKMVGNTTNALLIDYHLLLCLLFAEHSIEIDSASDEEEGGEKEEESPCVETDNAFLLDSSQMSGLGYTFGVTCIVLQLICGLQYFGYVKAWSNIFPIIADTSVIIFGFMLLKVKGTPQRAPGGSIWRETNSKGVDVMVAMMGITGFLFWIILSIFNATWAYTIRILPQEQRYLLKWNCAKNCFRSIGILFQMYFFMKSDPHIGCRSNMRYKKLTYFILPSLMLSLLAVFIMAVIDSRSEVVETLLDDSKINHVLMVLLKAGEPLYLGFCLHLFLHFFIINNNMRNQEKGRLHRDRGTVRPRNQNKGPLPRCSSCPPNQLSVRFKVNKNRNNSDSLAEPLLGVSGD